MHDASNEYSRKLNANNEMESVAIKKLELMPDARIVQGFGRADLKVVHNKAELVTLLEKGQRRNVIGAFMSSGDFNGLTTDDLKALYG